MIRPEFMIAYERWRDEPFPYGSGDDDGLSELHSELAYVDAMVAEAAVPVANGRFEDGQVPDFVRADLRAVVAGASSYASSAVEEHASLAADYLRYAERLLKVIEELDQLGTSADGS